MIAEKASDMMAGMTALAASEGSLSLHPLAGQEAADGRQAV